MIKKITNFFKQRNSVAFKKSTGDSNPPWLDGVSYGISSHNNIHFKRIVENSYYVNVMAYRAVKILTDAVSQMPVSVYIDDKYTEEHWAYKLLQRPNVIQSRQEFVERLTLLLLLSGSSFTLGKNVFDNKPPDELWLLNPDAITMDTRVTDFIPRGVRCVGSAGAGYYPFSPIDGACDVLHLSQPDPLKNVSDKGLSAIIPSAYSIDIHNAGSVWNYSLLKRGARPKGGLKIPADVELTEEQQETLRTQLEEIYGGETSAGRPALFVGGAEWIEIGKTPVDMDWNNMRKEMAREIAVGIGVPPQLVGISDSQTFSNYKESRLSMYEDTAIPLANRIYSGIARWLNLADKNRNITISVNEDEVGALAQRREIHWDRLERSTILTINEKREELGYPPVLGGDNIYTSPQNVPLKYLSSDIFAGGLGEEEGDDEKEKDAELARILRNLKKEEVERDEAINQIVQLLNITRTEAEDILVELVDA